MPGRLQLPRMTGPQDLAELLELCHQLASRLGCGWLDVLRQVYPLFCETHLGDQVQQSIFDARPVPPRPRPPWIDTTCLEE